MAVLVAPPAHGEYGYNSHVKRRNLWRRILRPGRCLVQKDLMIYQRDSIDSLRVYRSALLLQYLQKLRSRHDARGADPLE